MTELVYTIISVILIMILVFIVTGSVYIWIDATRDKKKKRGKKDDHKNDRLQM